MSGRHQTSQQGSSVEFAQHRDYAPGDPIKHLDWKAYARSERFVVKEFESESNLQVVLILDRSRSMGFMGGATDSKLSFASRLAHAFSWLLLRQNDAVGLLSFSEGTPDYIPPSSTASQLQVIEDALRRIQAEGKTSLESVSDFITNRCHRNTVCIFLTDCLDESESDGQHLVHLKRKKYATYCIHLLSKNEFELKEDDPTIYVDEESEEAILTEPTAIKRTYARAIETWLNEIRTQCQHHGIPYLFSLTDVSPVDAVRRLTGHHTS